MKIDNFFSELKRRNVYKVGVAYAVVAWLLLQALSILLPAFEAPAWVLRVFIAAIAAGFPLALIFAWAFELTPEGIKRTEEVAPDKSLTRKTGRKLMACAAVVAVLATGLLAFQLFRPSSKTGDRETAAAASIPDKSIAVLPFENLSSEKENAYFTDGVQEEILTTLAKVADLKVISRTSVMQFRDTAKRDLPEIARALKVAHVLEGSVQRSGNRVRVSAQLIDARTDAHLWAERYDRDLADVFAIQSEIAQKIATQLQAVLSPREQVAMQAQPTSNLAAYDFYLRGKEVLRNSTDPTPANLTQELDLFEQAVGQDPGFVSALCFVARAHLLFYWYNLDHTESRIAAAKKALEAAAALQPDAAEVHVIRALLRYWVYRDYAGAIAELDAARRVLPNDAGVLYILGVVERRQGRWEEAIRHFEAALALDPRNPMIVASLGNTYAALHRYGDAAHVLDAALIWRPNDFDLAWRRAIVDFDSQADLRRMREVLSGSATSAASPESLARARLGLGILERDYVGMRGALSTYNAPVFSDVYGYITPREWFEGLAARGLRESERADAAFLSARAAAAAAAAARSDEAKALLILGEIDARLARKDMAISAAEHARQLLPADKDAFDGPLIEARVAGVYAQVGEIDRALDLLEQCARRPGGPSYGRLTLDEVWDPLRAHPRFQKLLASLAPEQAK